MKFGEVAKWFTAMPGWQQTIWVLWLFLGLLMLVLSLNSRRETSTEALSSRLDRIETTLKTLTAILNDINARGGSAVVVPLVIPEPVPEANVGWRKAVQETAGDQADQDVVGKLFAVVTEPTALVNAVLAGEASVPSIRLNEPTATEDATHTIHIKVQNKTQRPATFTIPKGQVFENADASATVQNLVVTNDVTVTVPPGGIQSVDLAAYCLNQNLPKPKGQNGNITPLRVRFTFSDQDTLWRGVTSVVPKPVAKQ